VKYCASCTCSCGAPRRAAARRADVRLHRHRHGPRGLV
jgi:hypothetical protein